MQVVYHIGAHVTDEDRLLRCLLKNTDQLRKIGSIVPGPGRYRRLIGDTLAALSTVSPDTLSAEALLDSIAEDDNIQRLVLSFEAFSAGPRQIVRDGMLYARMEQRIKMLSQLFGPAQYEFHMAMRNPVSFISALSQRDKMPSLGELMSEIDLNAPLWSDVIRRIRSANPDARIVVWCNEDAPILWGDLLRNLADLPMDGPDLEGSHEFLADLLTEDGASALRKYLAQYPPQLPEERHRLAEEFLDRFANPDQVEDDIDLPGWNAADVEHATARYYEDVDYISRMRGVELIQP